MRICTERDREIMDYIKEYYRKNGYSPSVRDIGKELYISRSAVCYHLLKLSELGFLKITPKTPRSIVLIVEV